MISQRLQNFGDMLGSNIKARGMSLREASSVLGCDPMRLSDLVHWENAFDKTFRMLPAIPHDRTPKGLRKCIALLEDEQKRQRKTLEEMDDIIRTKG